VRHDCGAFVVEQINHSGDATVSVCKVPDALLICVHSGTLTCISPAERRPISREQISLLNPTDDPVSLDVTDVRVTLVHLVRPEQSPGIDNQAPIAALTGSPRTPAASEALKRTISYVTDVVTVVDPETSALMTDAVAALLNAAVSATFAAAAGEGRPWGGPYPAPLELALRYLEDNAAKRITVADLAAQIFVTPRTVQYLFRRHLDTTPTAHLRLVRLRKVRRELVDGDRFTTTVTTSATRWGFGHTGRFAVLYREVYGESPHETLRRTGGPLTPQ
jgi:AraC-like DNA-binding protein